MQGILYEEPSAWLFLLVTVVMGGGAAWMTGRACAITWRPAVVLALYLVVLAAAVRFIHMALFHQQSGILLRECSGGKKKTQKQRTSPPQCGTTFTSIPSCNGCALTAPRTISAPVVIPWTSTRVRLEMPVLTSCA